MIDYLIDPIVSETKKIQASMSAYFEMNNPDNRV